MLITLVVIGAVIGAVYVERKRVKAAIEKETTAVHNAFYRAINAVVADAKAEAAKADAKADAIVAKIEADIKKIF